MYLIKSFYNYYFKYTVCEMIVLTRVNIVLCVALFKIQTVFGAEGSTAEPKCKSHKVRNVASFPFAFPTQNNFRQRYSDQQNPLYAVDMDTSVKLKEIQTYHCAHTEPGELSWWQVDLWMEFVVEKVVIHTIVNESFENNFKVAVSDSNNRFRPIIENDTLGSDADTICHRVSKSKVIDFDCACRVGSFVTIMGMQSGKPLVLCEVEVFGTKPSEINVAIGKPTSQSSTAFNADSSLAVDGIVPKDDRLYALWNTPPPYCTLTAKAYHYPWWAVDLLDVYIVERIFVYNRGEDQHFQLHDVEFRIGGNDVKVIGNRAQLLKNSLCRSYSNKYFPAGKSVVTCTQPLAGRYVSIQIVKFCSESLCGWTANRRNVLTLCEVQVFGNGAINRDSDVILPYKSFDYYYEGNRVVEEIGVLFPWMSMDLGRSAIVRGLVLKLSLQNESQKVPTFEIRVGNVPITQQHNNKLFKSNTVCQIEFWTAEAGVKDLPCYQLVFGRYVTVQVTEPCKSFTCMDDFNFMISFEKFEVFGYKIQKPQLKLSEGKHTLQSSSHWLGPSKLAVDGKIPQTLSTSNFVENCARTIADKHPWLAISLPALFLIHEVVVYLPGDGNNTRFKNFNIRIYTRNYQYPYDDHQSPKKSIASICDEGSTKVLPEGKNSFLCDHPLIGNVVEIEISTPKFEYNVINVCEVEAYGCAYPDETVVEEATKHGGLRKKKP